jgi:lysine 2,3-aminomutase
MKQSSASDWLEQLKRQTKNVEQLGRHIDISDEVRAEISEATSKFPMAITPYFLEKALSSPALLKQILPTKEELEIAPADLADPLGEERDEVAPGLVHRYPDRVLLLVTDTCASYCRFCTRKRVVGGRKIPFARHRLERCFDYVRAHEEIRDVIMSGGDPLILSDEKLEYVVASLRAIPHVEIVRIGTRVPAFLPHRITDELCAMLKKYQPIYFSLHFDHPDEVTGRTVEALAKIADSGFPLGSQTVLLRGVNDDIETMRELMRRLLRCRVRPYYLYQCDLALGIEHFRTTVEKGLEIVAGLRGFISGYACPTYCVDLPNGGGKVPMIPEYLKYQEGNRLVFRNFEGREFIYTEPEIDEPSVKRFPAVNE